MPGATDAPPIRPVPSRRREESSMVADDDHNYASLPTELLRNAIIQSKYRWSRLQASWEHFHQKCARVSITYVVMEER
jgi:hypothetical protein